MGFDKQNQKPSDSGTGNTSAEIAMNVVIDDGAFQEASDDTQVRQQLRSSVELCGTSSDLENIIMDGDIILNIHEDGEDGSHKEYQIISAECAEHSHLAEHQDETLIKFGDKFENHKHFLKYVKEHSNKWFYYYKCTESKNADTESEAYTYNCVFLRNRDYKRKGVKKRFYCKTDCPCKVKLRRKPGEGLMVTYVCNHHDHELSQENFNKIQQNRKLPPYIKEIIMDLLALEVEVVKIRKFVEMETGVKMSRSFFYEMERKMKLKNEERLITDKRLKELSSKMCVVDEMYSCDEDENTDDQQPPKNKRVKLSTSTGIISKFEEEAACENLEESLNNMEGSSWMQDQSTAAQRTSTMELENSTFTSVKTEQGEQTYDTAEEDTMPEDYTHEYTVDTTAENIEHQDENDQEKSYSQMENVVLQDEYGNIINNENIVILQQDENGAIQDDQGNIGYFDGEQIIFMPEGNHANHPTEQTEVIEQNEIEESAEASSACDASVQTSTKPGHSYVPVFDVYMKNGNVTGFLVNDDAVKENADKSAISQTSQEDSLQEPQLSESALEQLCDINASNATQEYICGDTYTKHEYIHRYNIDHYMSDPRFPKYIETLAKKTRTDVLRMLTRVYSEKAMFKMTTTQKGKEGNTKIWYLTDVRRKGKYKMSDEEKMKKDKMGQYITDILILKERVKLLKKDNEELITRNKYLEEVALRLAKMNESN